MIQLPNHLSEEESDFLAEEAELRLGSFVFNLIPNQLLSSDELAARNEADTTYSFGEWGRLLNTTRLLQRPGGYLPLEQVDMGNLMTRLKQVNPSPKMSFSYSINPSIQTNLPLLGTVLDETIKEVVRKIKNREVDLNVSRRSVSGEVKYPDAQPKHEEYLTFELSCKGRPFPRGINYENLFSKGTPLCLLGYAAKSLEGMVGISRGQKKTSVIFYHPAYNSQ